MSEPLSPRDYQRQHLIELLEYDGPNTALFYGVGGGKTATSLMYASLKVARGEADLVIVVTPQTQLMKQFMSCSKNFGSFTLDGETHKFIEFDPRTDVRGVSSRLRAFLDMTTGRAMTIAPQVLCKHVTEVSAALRTKKILFVLDECHHINETEKRKGEESEVDADQAKAGTEAAKALGELLAYVRINEIPRDHFQRMYLSATPYRTDNLPVYPKGQIKECYKRLVALMVHNYAPERIQVELIQAETDSERVRAIYAKWVEDGKPVTHIKLPGQSITTTDNIIADLIEVFGRDTIVNTRGEQGKEALTQASNLNKLWADGEIPYSEIPKVYVSVQRMTEGVDIPSICCTYIWGISSSMLQTEQVLGRGMRNRKELEALGYPSKWIPLTKMVFCTGLIEKIHLERYLIRLCCYMESLDFISLLSRMLPENDGLAKDTRKRRDEVLEFFGDPALIAEAVLIWKSFIPYWALNVVRTPNSIHPETHLHKFVESAYQFYADRMKDYPEDPFEDASEDEVKKCLTSAIVMIRKEAQTIRAPMQIDEMRDSNILDVITRLVPFVQEAQQIFTGTQISEIHKRVLTDLQAGDDSRPQTIEEVLDRVSYYRSAEKKWPVLNEDVKDIKNTLWSFKDYARKFPDLTWKIVTTLSKNGVATDLSNLCRVFEDAYESPNPRTRSVALRRLAKDIQAVSNEQGAPLGVYFPNAVRAILATDISVFTSMVKKVGELKALKTLNRIGHLSQETVQAVYQSRGVEGLLEL